MILLLEPTACPPGDELPVFQYDLSVPDTITLDIPEQQFALSETDTLAHVMDEHGLTLHTMSSIDPKNMQPSWVRCYQRQFSHTDYKTAVQCGYDVMNALEIVREGVEVDITKVWG